MNEVKEMDQREKELYLIDYLLNEENHTLPTSKKDFDLYRSLVNQRYPYPINETYLKLEDEYLQGLHRPVIQPDFKGKKILLFQGDITTLKVDAIVNAANNQMLGCFVPGHYCIDNAIHTFAGMRLRLACFKMMKEQGHLEPTGHAKLTLAYNLPSQYIIHTVGPIVQGRLTPIAIKQLENCYENCMKCAYEHSIKTLAFCCISTGVFGFPKEKAAKIAIKTVKRLQKNYPIPIVFNVFDDQDKQIYEKILEEEGIDYA